MPSEERVYRTRRSPTIGAAAQTTSVPPRQWPAAWLSCLLPPSPSPAAQGRIPSPMPQNLMRALYQQLAQIWIAALRDPQLRIACAALPLLRPQAQEPCYIPAVHEPLGTAQGEHERHRREPPHAWNTLQSLYLRVLFGQRADLLVVVVDLLTQRIDLLQQSAQRRESRADPPGRVVRTSL
jgi:hypothetical protein